MDKDLLPYPMKHTWCDAASTQYIALNFARTLCALSCMLILGCIKAFAYSFWPQNILWGKVGVFEQLMSCTNWNRCILFLPHGWLDLCCEVISPNYLQCVNILREWVNRKYFIFMPFLFYTFICIICSYFFSDNRAAYFELFFVEQFICTCRCWMANQSNIFLFCLLKM